MLLHQPLCQRLLAVSTALLLISSLSGCTLPSQKQQGDGSGYLFTVSLPSNPKSLDPQSAADSASKTIIENLYEGLMELDETGTPVTAAADSYTISPDGLVYTFTLKSDRYWYFDENENDVIDDGESWPVTAADYSFAFRRILDPETQSPYAETFSCIAGGKEAAQGTLDVSDIGVQALSSTELRFTLAEPCAEFLSLLTTTAAMPCCEDFFLQTKGRYGLDQKSVASCGAFYLRLWFYDPYGSDNLIYMRRNAANTAARAVYPANLTFHIRKNAEEAAADFTSGESDVLTTSVWQGLYSNTSKYHVTSSRSTTLGLVFNPDDKVFANQNIRRGLSMSIDRSAIGTESEDDLTGAAGIIPPAVLSGGQGFREQYPETNPYQTESAVSAFQQGMKELHIESIDTTKILVCPTLMNCDNLHDIIQTWQEIFGFYIGIEEVSEADYWNRMENKNYTIAICAVSGAENSPASVLRQFQSDANRFYYNSKTVDQMLTGLAACDSDAALGQYCAQIEQTILEEALFIPVFYKNQYCVTSSGNQDIRYDPFSGALNFRDAKHFE